MPRRRRLPDQRLPHRTPPRARRAAGKPPSPAFCPLALATLKPKPPAGDAWVHEIKFDGYRIEAQLRAGRVRLLTRSGQDWSGRFGTAIAEAVAALPARSAILDGEIVVEGPAGASDFSALQADLSAGRSDRFRYYVFDLLHVDGADLRKQPLHARKARLAALVAEAPEVVRLSEDFAEDGEAMLDHACRLSLEGLVSKRRDGAYPAGRTGGWIKSKCSDRQEFVIAGFVPSTVAPDRIGSLVLGVHRDGGLVPVGRVGTGFSQQVGPRPLRPPLAAVAQDRALRRQARRRPAARRDLGPALPRRRGRVPRLDGRRPAPPRQLPRPARGQARPRGGARGARRGRLPPARPPARPCA